MDETSAFIKLEKSLQESDLDCSIFEPTEEVPFSRLLVFLGSDNKNHERIVEITLQQQVLGQEFDSENNEGYLRIQFQVKFPYTIEDLATSQVASLLHFLNRLIELPGFEMDEVENALYFRHVFLTSDPDKKVCLAILGIIAMLFELFTETIEQVASGQKTFNDLLEEVIKIAKRTSKS